MSFVVVISILHTAELRGGSRGALFEVAIVHRSLGPTLAGSQVFALHLAGVGGTLRGDERLCDSVPDNMTALGPAPQISHWPVSADLSPGHHHGTPIAARMDIGLLWRT